ncbi:MAG: GTPase Era [Chromatiales bacterium 21-64-14]|nr:MAG: GTPase Era [Chromatiales bacterium 21-64-14]
MSKPPTRCGFIAIIGRPNVGKSTLLNRLVGQKISITAPRPQTTRHRIHGVKTVGPDQAVYVDTPGLHRESRRTLNRYLNRTARSALHDVDALLFVVEALHWTGEDQYVEELIRELPAPAILVVNKVDKVVDKTRLLPYLEERSRSGRYRELFPASAQDGDNVEALERKVMELLPSSVHLFPDDQVTDRSQRFLAAELVREKLTRRLGQEIPYALAVSIEDFEELEALIRIRAVIWVERDGQKKIVIGKGGGVLKEIGRLARLDLEHELGKKVFLELWVKVREGWSDDSGALSSLGYDDAFQDPGG